MDNKGKNGTFEVFGKTLLWLSRYFGLLSSRCFWVSDRKLRIFWNFSMFWANFESFRKVLWDESSFGLKSKDEGLSKSLWDVMELRRRISRCFESFVWAIYIVVGLIERSGKMGWILLLFYGLGLMWFEGIGLRVWKEVMKFCKVVWRGVAWNLNSGKVWEFFSFLWR